MKLGFFKLAAVVILAFACIGLTACTDNSDKNRTDSESSDNDKNQKDEKKDGSFTETADEQVLIDESGVKVTFKKLKENEQYGKGMILYLENNTDQTLMFDCKDLLINGNMCEDVFAEMLDPGESGESTVYLDSVEFANYGIDKIGEIQFQMDFYDAETFDMLLSADMVSIKTSEYENMKTEIDFDGELIYDKNDVMIYAKYVESDDMYKRTAILYTVNNGADEIIMKIESTYINGIDMYKAKVTSILEGKCQISHIFFTEEEYKNAQIESAKKVQIPLTIYNRRTLETMDIIDTEDLLDIFVK